MKRFILKWILGSYFNFYIKRVEGLENLKKDETYVIVANHNSVIDGIFIIYLYMKKTNNFISVVTRFSPINNTKKSRFIKNFFEKFGSFFTEFISTWDKNVTNNAIQRLIGGKSVLIFPEGVSNMTQVLLKARTGAARIALLSNTKVLPVGVMYSERIIPLKTYFPRFHRLVIRFGKPIDLSKYNGYANQKDKLDGVSRIFMKEIAKLCEKQYPH